MSTAREEILDRIRRANANAGVPKPAPRPKHAALPRPSDADALDRDAVVAMFTERVEDYRAVVERSLADEVATRVAAAVQSANGVLVPEGFPTEWSSELTPVAIRTDRADARRMTADELDSIEAVVTTSALGIARTGTIVLDHTAGQGRRALTLVPDLHVCLVRAADVHLDVPDAVRALRPSVDAGHALTWISGPSATSDIELSRVEGVHGPRRLHVIIVD